MPIVIDPEFSVYHMVERVQRQRTHLNHRRTMSLISYEIENATLKDNSRSRIFSGFQVMSKFLPQIDRYTVLAEKAESVYVFGVPDVTPPPIKNITYVPLAATDQLAKEWFLVSRSQDFHSALATEEQTDLSMPDDERVFMGMWTFDVDLVQIVEEWLTGIVDATPYDMHHPDATPITHPHYIEQSLTRLQRYLAREPKVRTDIHRVIKLEVEALINQEIAPLLAS